MNNFLFVRSAQKIESLITKGTFKEGEKLPSLRKLHREWGISIGTALQAYTYLADRGWVTGRMKSGFFVQQRFSTETELPTVAIAQTVGEREVAMERLLNTISFNGRSKKMISFFDAVPTLDMLPYNAIRRAVQKVSRNLDGNYISYELPQGNLRLRELIAKRSYQWKGNLNSRDIVITNGALEAITICLLATTSPGDTVVVETPCYYGILQCIENLKLKVIELPSDSQHGIALDELEGVCKKFDIAACVLISNFNNPNGVMITEEKKKALARFAAKSKIPIIEDDIYGDLFFGKLRPTTIKSYDTGGWVLLCNSFSKTLVPGFRIGWCAAGRYHARVLHSKTVTNIATASLTQLVVSDLLETGSYERHLRKLRLVLERNLAFTRRAVERWFPTGTRISDPRGGYVLWVELPKKIHSGKLRKIALEHAINLAPGIIFSSQDIFKNYIRISCNNIWDNKIENAIQRIGELCKGLL